LQEEEEADKPVRFPDGPAVDEGPAVEAPESEVPALGLGLDWDGEVAWSLLGGRRGESFFLEDGFEGRERPSCSLAVDFFEEPRGGEDLVLSRDKRATGNESEISKNGLHHDPGCCFVARYIRN
jgi:hypothetical protein